MLKKIIATAAVAVAIIAASFTTTPAAFAGGSSVAKSGHFEGRSDHITTGGVSIVKTSSGYLVLLEGDFSLDGAPDPTIGFGNGGDYDKSSEFTQLANIAGQQAYAIPASVDPSKFSEIYIWCAKFSVPLGVASLK